MNNSTNSFWKTDSSNQISKTNFYQMIWFWWSSSLIKMTNFVKWKIEKKNESN